MNAKLKSRIRKILKKRDLTGLLQWAQDTKTPLRKLFSLTYEADPAVSHGAIDAIGRIAAVFADANDMERVRNFIRSLLWLMAEESGGVGWLAPEALAEICIRVPELVPEFAKLLPQFLQEESFRPSTLAALYRIAPVSPDIFENFSESIEVLSSEVDRFEVWDWTRGEFFSLNIQQLLETAEKNMKMFELHQHSRTKGSSR